MDTNKMREQFEEFHRAHLEQAGMDLQDISSEFDRKDNGDYVYSMAQDGWIYWQASREALVVKLPDPRVIILDRPITFGPGMTGETLEAANRSSHAQYLKALEAQGLRVSEAAPRPDPEAPNLEYVEPRGCVRGGVVSASRGDKP